MNNQLTIRPATEGPSLILDPSKRDVLVAELEKIRLGLQREPTSMRDPVYYMSPGSYECNLVPYTIIVIEELLAQGRIQTWQVCRDRTRPEIFSQPAFQRACEIVAAIDGVRAEMPQK